MKLPHIGMRKLKSLLAIFVGFWIWQLIRLAFPELEVHPLFIYIYGLVEIRDTSKKTVELGGARIKATLIAISLALPMIYLMNLIQQAVTIAWVSAALDLGFLLAGVLIVLMVAEALGCKTFCGIAAIIYIILLIYHAGEDRYVYSVLRALQTILGVGVAWLINVKLFPYEGNKKPKTEMSPETPETVKK